MLSFALSGTLHCVLTTASDELTLVLSSPLEQPDAPPRLAWILCAVRDVDLRAAISDTLRCGDSIWVEGHIEQRRRAVRELAFHSVVFVARSVGKSTIKADGQ